MSRLVILDTETTGLESSKGHRIIEIGCEEMVDRKLTNNRFYCQINPDREIDDGAMKVHGITKESLADKPRFHEIADDFLSFVKGAELVIHNAPFDVGFINYELSLLKPPKGAIETYCEHITDTLVYYRKKHPGKKSNLRALCKQYGVDIDLLSKQHGVNSTLHGASVDARLLAEVYLCMTGGQASFSLDSSLDGDGDSTVIRRLPENREHLPVIMATDEECRHHEETLADIAKKSDGHSL
ncbi:MAG: DNA polymerase III subunit epsilon [Endozoicomonadaceae bacterium]|nr:DNA polymerase III subunit epsilon [Endozoicomonadaceae bacterium]